MAWPKKFFGAFSSGGPLLLQTLGPGPALDGPGKENANDKTNDTIAVETVKYTPIIRISIIKETSGIIEESSRGEK